MRLFTLLFLSLWVVPTGLYASIYGYVDERGAYHFTNIRPANKEYVIVVKTMDPASEPGRHPGRPWHDDAERLSLINHAKALLGVPYKLGGEGLTGIDCSAFVRRMFSTVDTALPRTAREQYDAGRKIARQDLTMGDLVFFKTRQHEQYPTHVGIYMGNDQFIHASALKKGGVRIDALSSDFYNARFIGGSRIRALPETGSTLMATASKQ